MDATDAPVAIDGAASPLSDADYLGELPRGLIEAQLIEAEQDAYRVSSYLEVFMSELAGNYPDQVRELNWRTMFSAKTLLELAAAIRVLEWEQNNLVRPSMNLPDGNEAIRQALLNANNDDLQGQLSQQLIKVFVENFAWSSMRDLGAHVLLDQIGANEDEVVDYMAQLLLRIVREGRSA